MQLRTEKKSVNDISIQDPIDGGFDGNSLTLNDIVADEFDLHESFEAHEESKELRKIVNSLSGRERQVIVLRYGLNNNIPLTQQQVSELLNISRSYVSRIEKKALAMLKELLCGTNAESAVKK